MVMGMQVSWSGIKAEDFNAELDSFGIPGRVEGNIGMR
jgi:hypothetical protein